MSEQREAPGNIIKLGRGLFHLADDQLAFGLAFFHRMLILGGGFGDGAGDIAEQLDFINYTASNARLKPAMEPEMVASGTA